MRVDDVLGWLVKVTGLEPKLLSITAIVLVYVATVILYSRERENGGDVLSSKVDRVESALETLAGYLVNLESSRQETRSVPIRIPPRTPPRIPREPPEPVPVEPEAGSTRNVLEEVAKMSRRSGRGP